MLGRARAALLIACVLNSGQATQTLVLSADGITVYDAPNGVTWLANANLQWRVTTQSGALITVHN